MLIELRIPCLTVYALSLENISNRSAEEVNQLFELIAMGLDELRRSADIRDYDIRVNIAGARAALPHRLRQAADSVEEETKMRGAGGLLTICLAYGGRQDLVLYPSLPRPLSLPPSSSLPPSLPPLPPPSLYVASYLCRNVFNAMRSRESRGGDERWEERVQRRCQERGERRHEEGGVALVQRSNAYAQATCLPMPHYLRSSSSSGSSSSREREREKEEEREREREEVHRQERGRGRGQSSRQATIHGRAYEKSREREERV